MILRLLLLVVVVVVVVVVVFMLVIRVPLHAGWVCLNRDSNVSN